MAITIDKELLKEKLNELIQQDPVSFRDIISEVVEKNNSETNEVFLQSLKKSFSRFDKTYKALA